MSLQKNKVEEADSREYYQFESYNPWTSYAKSFHEYGVQTYFVKIEVLISEKMLVHLPIKNTIDLLDLMNEVGGFAFCLYIAFYILISSMSHFEQELDLIENLYMFHSKDDEILRQIKRVKVKDEIMYQIT